MRSFLILVNIDRQPVYQSQDDLRLRLNRLPDYCGCKPHHIYNECRIGRVCDEF
jgi:hypothetical protein